MSSVQLTSSEAAVRLGMSAAQVRALLERLCIKQSGWRKTNRIPTPTYYFSDIIKIKKYEEARKKLRKNK